MHSNLNHTPSILWHTMDLLGIVLNTKAKNFASYSSYVKAITDSNIPHELYKTSPNNLNDVIKKCIQKHSVILIGGGDGTIRSAVQYCANTSVVMGVLPLGTLNHFSKELNLPSNAEELIQALQTIHITSIDVSEVNGQFFVNNSSIGFYPSFADRRERYTKFYNKWLSYIPSFIDIFKRHKSFNLSIKNKKLNLTIETSFLMISNNLYVYKFPFHFERKSFKGGKLGIYYYKHGKLGLKKILIELFSKKNLLEIKTSKEPIEVTFKDNTTINISLDGETMNMQTPLLYRSHPSALKIITKKP